MTSDPCEEKRQAVNDAIDHLNDRLVIYHNAVAEDESAHTIAQAWALVQAAMTALSTAQQELMDCLGLGSGGAG